MKRASLFIFCLFLSTSLAVENLFDGIQEKEQKGTKRKLDTPEVVYGSVSEEVQSLRTQQSFQRTRWEKLKNLNLKLAILDEAVSLPADKAEKHREKQTGLTKLKRHLANQHVEDMLRSPQTGSKPGGLIHDPVEYLNQEAKKMVSKLPPEQKKDFILNWKASLSDTGSKRQFTTYLASLKMYGHGDPMVQSQNKSMQKMRDQYLNGLEADSKIPFEEEVDLAYQLVRGQKHLFSQGTKARFKRIEILEGQFQASMVNPREARLYARKLQWEKEVLLDYLKKEGLDVFSQGREDFTLELEEKLLEWKAMRVENKELYTWPFEEKGETLQSFMPELFPYTIIQTKRSHGILAVCDGKIREIGKDHFSLDCKNYYLHFMGPMKIEKKANEDLKSADLIARSKPDHKIKVVVYDVQDGSKAIDLMELY